MEEAARENPNHDKCKKKKTSSVMELIEKLKAEKGVLFYPLSDWFKGKKRLGLH